jgi:hypothetical protein
MGDDARHGVFCLIQCFTAAASAESGSELQEPAEREQSRVGVRWPRWRRYQIEEGLRPSFGVNLRVSEYAFTADSVSPAGCRSSP